MVSVVRHYIYWLHKTQGPEIYIESPNIRDIVIKEQAEYTVSSSIEENVGWGGIFIYMGVRFQEYFCKNVHGNLSHCWLENIIIKL